MTMVWIVLGILGYLGVAVLLGLVVGRRGLTRLRDELLEEALPGAPTGDRRHDSTDHPGRLEWTEATNLTALSMQSPPVPREEIARPAPSPESSSAAPTGS